MNSHFLLAMHESPTAARDSSDSMTRKQSENTFRPVVNSGDQQQESKARKTGGKHQERNLSRKGWMGRNNHRNLLHHSIKYLQQASDSCRLPCAFLSRYFPDKNSITSPSEIRQAKNPAKLSSPWNNPVEHFKLTFQTDVLSVRFKA